MKTTFIFCMLFATLLATITAQRATSISEVHKLYIEDQRDRGVGTKAALSGIELSTRDQERRARVHQMLKAGLLETAQDFHDAAFIYQHGQTSEDYLLAHVLATVAVAKGDNKSLWISAATLDRYLYAIHKPQVFGTQYHWTDDQPVTQEPYERTLIPDQLRAVLCVPSVKQQAENLRDFQAGKYPGHMIPNGCTR